MRHDRKHYQRLFSALDVPTPPADLARKTLLAIVRRERRKLAAKLIALGAMFAASLAIAVSELTAAGVQLGQSGFFQFASLFFSDFWVAARNLPDILLSLLESFPALSAGLAMAGFVVALLSFSGLLEDARLLSRS